jgi:hypothetical protein
MRDTNDLRDIMLVSGVKSGQGTEEKTCAGTAEKTCAGTAAKFLRRMPLRMPALPGDEISCQEMETEASRLDKSCESEESETNDD